MKRLNIIMLLVTLISMGSIQTKAHDFEVNGMYYNIVSISEKTCEVTYRGADYSDARFKLLVLETMHSTTMIGGTKDLKKKSSRRSLCPIVLNIWANTH